MKKELVITVTEKDEDIKITYKNKCFVPSKIKKVIAELENLMLLNIKPKSKWEKQSK